MTTDITDAATAHAVARLREIVSHLPAELTLNDALVQAITETMPLIRTACRDEVIEELAREAGDSCVSRICRWHTPTLADWLRAQKGGEE